MDSNAVIEFLGETLPSNGSLWLEQLVGNNQHCLSVINRIELLSYNGDPSEMQVFADFIEASSILPLTEEVILKTIEIRKHVNIKLPDAIIAATALVHNLTLITRNVADFKRVTGLTLVNPHLL